MRIRSAAAGAVTASLFVLALGLAVRLLSLPTAFRDGQPQLVPLDDLYHAKRIIFSAIHFPRVLDWDPDRGLNGSYCPWPPLYDLALGGQAHLFGASTSKDIVRTAIWFPPLFTSLFAALVTVFLALRGSHVAGLVAGLMLALSPSLIGVSRIGTIDHHFLEPALAVALVAASALLCGGAPRAPSAVARGLFFALALLVALFIQTAMLLAAGLALLAILLGGRSPKGFAGASLGFALAAAGVLVYRSGRPAGYPDDAWYLGTSHTAALAAGAVACAVFGWGRFKEGGAGRRVAGASLCIAIGCLAAASVPGALTGIAQGAGFFGADPWLSQVQEFRPLFRGSAVEDLENLFNLGGGALLAIPFAFRSFRSGTPERRALAVFAIGFLLAAIRTARFTVPASGVLAISGALLIEDEVRRRRFRIAATAATLALLPGVVGLVKFLPEVRSIVPTAARPMLVAADFLRERGDPRGRVLGPWWAGHAFDVLGFHPVIVDNFGAAEGRPLFDEAIGLLLSPREERVASYCHDHGIRFLVVENPAVAVVQTARMLELPVSLYLAPVSTPGSSRPAYVPTRLLKASFWWRAYLSAEATSGDNRQSFPFRSFRLLYPDPLRFGVHLPLSSRALQIWEFVSSGL